MTCCGFYREAVRRSLHRAWEMGHTTHCAIIFIIGACVWVGLHFEEHKLIVFPFLVLFGAFLLGVFWFAYVIYRDEQAEKDNAVRELRELRTPKVEIMDEVDDGRWHHHYRIWVKNMGGVTAERIGVRLVRSDPPIAVLPLDLHCSGLDRGRGSALADVNPGPPAVFDVLRFSRETGQLDIAGAAHTEIIPVQKYRLTLCVHGRNMPSQEKDFIFESHSDSTFAFYSAPSQRNGPVGLQ